MILILIIYKSSFFNKSIATASSIFPLCWIKAFSISSSVISINWQKDGKYTPKVVVAVDLFGLPADYNAIKPICQKYGLLLLEDGAQGFGGEINGKKACSFGDISTTSFFLIQCLCLRRSWLLEPENLRQMLWFHLWGCWRAVIVKWEIQHWLTLHPQIIQNAGMC